MLTTVGIAGFSVMMKTLMEVPTQLLIVLMYNTMAKKTNLYCGLIWNIVYVPLRKLFM